MSSQVAITGTIVHVILSIVFTAVFAAIAPPMLETTGLGSTSGLAFFGIGFGIVLWLVNFYLIAPAAGWTWFPEQSDTVVQFLAHAFFFGGPAGWMLGRGRLAIGPTL